MGIMGVFKKINRRYEVAKKRFRGGIKEDIKEVIVEEEKVEEIVEEIVVEKKMNKDEFIASNGFSARPNSHKAISAWEEYKESL